MSVASALLIIWLLGPHALSTPRFFLAIILSAWISGVGPGLLAALLLSRIDLQRELVEADIQIPIIIIIGHGDDEARALGAGAVTFLRKPFSDEALLDAVQAVWQRPAHN